MKKTKIVITGGHGGTTALATVQKIQDLKLDWEIHWIGVRHSMEGSRAKTLEFKLFPGMGVTCHTIKTGRLQRKFTSRTIPSLFKLPFGTFQSFYLLAKIRPEIVLSYGGFAAFPVVIAAFFLKIPIIIHEQTAAVGLANKFSVPFAKAIAISRKESSNYFPPQKTVLVGNPVSKDITSISPKTKIGNPPVILIMGGSRGSQIINQAVTGILPKLLSQFEVIHLTGESAPKNLTHNRYKVFDFVEYKNILWNSPN